jgi:hypothetical protein
MRLYDGYQLLRLVKFVKERAYLAGYKIGLRTRK